MTTFAMNKRTRIGSWNVRTMMEASRLAQITKEMHSYRLDILGLSETRWNGSGEFLAATGETLLYSGKNINETHEYGVGILLSCNSRKSLLDWKPVSERIIWAKLRTKIRCVSLVQCYAPTDTSTVEDKTTFYEALTSTLNSFSSSDIIILMGDFNAKVGSDNTNIEHIMGKHAVGSRNANGDLFIDLCSAHNLVIGGTLFPHRSIHKVTWNSPDGRTHNQIDHIAISRGWRKSLLDVRVKRGADVASDHHLLVGHIQLKLAAQRQTGSIQKRVKFNVTKFSNKNILKQFSEVVTEKLQGLNLFCNTRDIEEEWNLIRDGLLETSNEVLGKIETKRKPWISDHTWALIKQRKVLKGNILASKTQEAKSALEREYSYLNKEVKKSARKDKRQRIDDLANQAQLAADVRNARELYKITRTLSNKGFTQNHIIKNQNNEIVTSSMQQLELWTEHIRNTLNTEQLIFQPAEQIEEPHNLLRIDTSPPTINEINRAILQLKNNKAAGPDNLPPEVFKYNSQILAPLLHPIIEKFWNQEKIPSSCKESLIVKLPKKGDLTLCNNWRGITLQNIFYKIFAYTLFARLSLPLEQTLRREQAGFRPLRSCIDQINSVRIIIEQSLEWRSPLYLIFIDFEQAFDKLNQDSIWRTLLNKGVPPKIISLLIELYNNASCCVLHQGTAGSRFTVHAGVKQGCILSPLLFNIVLDSVMTKCTSIQRGIQWTLISRLEDLDYADDVCLLSHTFQDMQAKLTDLASCAAQVGLKINIRKTKAMRINTRSINKFILYDQEVEDVTEFTYLGSIIATDGGALIDAKSRIQKARSAFGQLSNVWRSSQYNTKTKLRIFNTNVKSVLLYGSETWKITEEIIHSLQTFVNKCLRIILRVFWPNVIRNTDLWCRTNQAEIKTEIMKRKWKWIGHTLRREESHIARQALNWNPQGSRPRGRPKSSWKRTVLQEAKEEGKTWNEIIAMSRNRVRWQRFVEALCST